MMTQSLFERTTCACERCKACCKRQPGSLIPGDYERIKQHLGATEETMRTLFWASPGALAKTWLGKLIRIGTITPQYKKGRCVFLDENDRCRIHAVAPFGCSHFDTHMSWSEGQKRSMWMAEQQKDDKEYQALRDKLPYATHHKPNRYT
jgi:Fe-S-cluster containining protein